MLVVNPAFSQSQQNQLKSIYNSYTDMTYQSILQQSLRDATKRKHKKVLSNALQTIKKHPEIGKIKITQAIDSMSYFFLNHQEKDFIGYNNAYSFYKGFRSVYRGMNIHYYNKKCVYHRGRGTPFTLIDFLNGKINCGMPIGYPRGVNKYEVIRELDKGFSNLNKIAANKVDLFEAGKKMASLLSNLLVPNAYALSAKVKKGISIGLGIAAVIGVGAIFAGVMFSPLAIIGIPVIAGGAILCASFLGWEIGTSIHKRVKKRRNRNNNGN